MPSEQAIGTVIAYRRAGYGWLDWNGTRIWIHVQDVRDKQGHLLPALKVGWRIQCDVTPAPKGPRARNAVVVDTTTNTEGFQCPQTATT
jgi:cold shock CspA family protein